METEMHVHFSQTRQADANGNVVRAGHPPTVLASGRHVGAAGRRRPIRCTA